MDRTCFSETCPGCHRDGSLRGVAHSKVTKQVRVEVLMKYPSKIQTDISVEGQK